MKEWLPLSSKATAKILLFFDICKKNRHEGDFLLFYIFHALSYSFRFFTVCLEITRLFLMIYKTLIGLISDESRSYIGVKSE